MQGAWCGTVLAPYACACVSLHGCRGGGGAGVEWQAVCHTARVHVHVRCIETHHTRLSQNRTRIKDEIFCMALHVRFQREFLFSSAFHHVFFHSPQSALQLNKCIIPVTVLVYGTRTRTLHHLVSICACTDVRSVSVYIKEKYVNTTSSGGAGTTGSTKSVYVHSRDLY